MLTKTLGELHIILSKMRTLNSIAKIEDNSVTYEMEKGSCIGVCIMHVENVAIQEAVMSPDSQMKAHNHEHEEEIIIVVYGDVLVVTGSSTGGIKETRIIDNGVIVIPPNTNHAVSSQNGCKLIGITVPASNGYPKK